jgi:galactonate dehydratase
MKITDVKATVIGRQEPASGGSVWTFVRVYTDEGLVGTGECSSAGAGFSGFATKQAILTMKRLLIGQDPRDSDPICDALRQRGRYGGATAAPVVFAITGIENALYDIQGKALGVPVYRLLGGRYRDRIRLYADCHAGPRDEPASHAEKAAQVVGEGFSAVKFDADAMGRDLRPDLHSRTVTAAQMSRIIDSIAAIREEVGPAVDLAIDGHGAFDIPSALTLATAVEDLRLMWLEEPVPAENISALASIRARTRTPICTGENHYTRFEFLELLRSEAVDILSPDFAKAGGIAEAKRIADLAEAHYVPVAPHNVSSPLGMIAAAHVLACVPNFLALEFHARDVTWWTDLCTGGPFIEAGTLKVPASPGLGVDLDDRVARQFLWEGDEYFD